MTRVLKRYRLPVFFGVLLLLWLVFGSQILFQVSQLLTPVQTVPPLEGKLFYTQNFEGIWQVDMSNGSRTHWWTPPDGGMVTGIAASPDGSRLAIAYAPPAAEGFQIGTTDLYLSPADTPDLQPLFVREDRDESFRTPSWSPDGQRLYYTHLKPQHNEAGDPAGIRMTSEAVMPDGGTPEVILENAQQLTQSPDGSLFAYLLFDPVSYGLSIWQMAADGSDAQELLPVGPFQNVNNPTFAPDGTAILFSGSGPYQGDPVRLAPTDSVSAHGLPWDVWQMDLADGSLNKLTTSTFDGPWIAWGPDGTSMAVVALEGVYVWSGGQQYRVAATTSEGEITWAK